MIVVLPSVRLPIKHAFQITFQNVFAFVGNLIDWIWLVPLMVAVSYWLCSKIKLAFLVFCGMQVLLVIGGSSLARSISITSHFWVVKEARVHTLTTTLVYYGSFCFGQPPTFLLKGHHEKRTAVNDRGKAAEYSSSEALLWNKLCFGLFQYSSI